MRFLACFHDKSNFRFFQANDLTSLPLGVFDGLTSLYDLFVLFLKASFVRHSILNAWIPSSHFTSCLREFSYNQLTALPNGVFSQLPNVQTLLVSFSRYVASLVSQRIFYLPKFIIPLRSFARTLNVPIVPSDPLILFYLPRFFHNSKLTSLPEGVFKGLTALTDLFVHVPSFHLMRLNLLISQSYCFVWFVWVGRCFGSARSLKFLVISENSSKMI